MAAGVLSRIIRVDLYDIDAVVAFSQNRSRNWRRMGQHPQKLPGFGTIGEEGFPCNGAQKLYRTGLRGRNIMHAVGLGQEVHGGGSVISVPPWPSLATAKKETRYWPSRTI